MMDAGRINHIVMRAELDALICSGAPRGAKHTYALICERAPQAMSLTREEALARLTRTYFSSHAPATAEDFAWWSGLAAVDVRQAMDYVRGEFVQEQRDGRQYWFNHGLSGIDAATGMHLLPAFDEYIIAYRDRSAVLPAPHLRKAVSSNGIFRPVILRDGLAAGLWKKVTGKRGPAGAEFFEAPLPQDKDIFASASARFAEFLNSDGH